ncbi:protein RFT1 homolog isoform X2 [Bolinopsis microptera]|uniref:protein RFT1 homolog isoform X2 n=1 Tax=Bolinopsis microptera TaxID=2820187 RepID=UPI00307A8053
MDASAVARGASSKAISQVFLKLISFLANGYLIRLVSNEVLGVVYIRLYLLYATIQILSREPLRKVCLAKHPPEQWPQLVSLIWISIPFSAMLGCSLTLLWVLVLETPDLPHYTAGCVIFAVCAVMELFAEPPHVYLLNKHFVRSPIIVEAVASLLQTLITVAVAHYSSSLVPFIVGAVVYSVLYVMVYWIIYRIKRSKDDLMFYGLSKISVSPEHASLTISFLKQTVLKQVLTMGEDYVMTFLSVVTFAQQGVFSTVSRLAAIVIRVGFKHVEDSYYLFFAQMLRRGLPPDQQGRDALKTCKETLGNLLRFNALFGLVVTVYGLSYARLALLIYGGQSLASSDGPWLLQWHCPYIAVCGINGVSECFYFATMSQMEVENYNLKLLPFSACFLILSVVLSYLFGTVGFILANIGNMAIRIFFSLRYTAQYFGGLDTLYRTLPNIPQLMIIAVCGCTALLSKLVLESTESPLGYLCHIIIGGLSFVLVLLTLWECEDLSFKSFLKSLNPIKMRTKTE